MMHASLTLLKWRTQLAVPGCLFVALLGGCAGPGLSPLATGLTEAEVAQRWGAPTGRYTLP